jgi:BCL2-like 1 (apoptosis regulator Bcl-X)
MSSKSPQNADLKHSVASGEHNEDKFLQNGFPNMKVFTSTTSSKKVTTVQQIAAELGGDIASFMCGVSRGPINKYASTMRRCAQEISIKHEYLFNGMMSKLHLTMENVDVAFQQVVREMFAEDGDVSWERVVAIYAFAGRVAQHLLQQRNTKTAEVIRKVSDICGVVVAGKLQEWVDNQGGWESFLLHFPDEAATEKSVWRGLVLTAALGLGALATMAAARG